MSRRRISGRSLTDDYRDSVVEESPVNALQTGEERARIVEQLYSALNPWETRLLNLHAGNFDDPLTADLDVAVLTVDGEGLGLTREHRNVAYEALSYTRGGEVFSHSLRCNGLEIGITRNLAAALRYLRQDTVSRYLWVDAVCINQSDAEEKARQIRELSIIFNRAHSVIAWLGESCTETASAAEYLRLYQSQRDKYMERKRAMNESSVKVHNAVIMAVRDWNEFESLQHSPGLQWIVKGLWNLSQRPWLARAWILQEVHVARAIAVHCGRHVMSWASFACLDKHIEFLRTTDEEVRFNNGVTRAELQNVAHGSSVNAFNSAMKAIRYLAAIPSPPPVIGRPRSTVVQPRAGQRRSDSRRSDRSRFRSRSKAVSELYSLIRGATHIQASDPRDKIWALVGLTQVSVVYGEQENDPATSIHIDYTKPVAQVYCEVTKFFFHSMSNRSGSLFANATSDESLPSWCLDFRNGRPLSCDTSRSMVGSGNAMAASKRTPLAAAPSATHSPSSNNVSGLTTSSGTAITSTSITPSEPIGSPDPFDSDWRCLTLRGWHIGTIRKIHKSDWPRSSSSTASQYVTVTVKHTPFLNNMIVCHGGRLLPWKDVSEDFVAYHHRRSIRSRTKDRGLISRLLISDRKYVPVERMYGYVNGEYFWNTSGNPMRGDIIVRFDDSSDVAVLRVGSDSRSVYVGAAWPSDDLVFTSDALKAPELQLNEIFAWPHPHTNSGIPLRALILDTRGFDPGDPEHEKNAEVYNII